MTGRRAVDTRAACAVVAAIGALLRDLIRVGGSSRPACGRVTRPRCGDLLLAAGPVNGLLAGYVCTSMWITCAKRRRACAPAVEMLGIPPPGSAHKRAFNWENATRVLWMQKKPELSTRRAVKAYK